MLEASLKAKPKGCWVTGFVDSHPEAQIRILDCKILGESKGVQHFFEIILPPHIISNMVRSIRNDATLYDIELVTSKSGRIHGSFKIRDHTCGFSNMSGVYLKSAYSTTDNNIGWNILGDSDSVPLLLKKLDEENIKVKVTKLGTFNSKWMMTGRQEHILKMAFERGYFDHPKKTRLKDLAKKTGTTPSALTQILRKGLRKVLKEYFIKDSI